jgi:hypothetical protein
MKKINSFIVATALVVFFCFFMTENAFSQTADTVNKTEITEAKKSTLFNEGGYVRGITPARAIGLVELAFGITSIVLGLRARKRAKSGIGIKGQKGAIVALSLGVIAIVISIIHLSITAGAVLGSGSGKAGAILAIILSLVGVIINGLVLGQKKA